MYWKLQEDPNWTPYCLMCRCLRRMMKIKGGFFCSGCKIAVDFDMNKMTPAMYRGEAPEVGATPFVMESPCSDQ